MLFSLSTYNGFRWLLLKDSTSLGDQTIATVTPGFAKTSDNNLTCQKHFNATSSPKGHLKCAPDTNINNGHTAVSCFGMNLRTSVSTEFVDTTVKGHASTYVSSQRTKRYRAFVYLRGRCLKCCSWRICTRNPFGQIILVTNALVKPDETATGWSPRPVLSF